jgi:hypothetical protein
VQRRHGYVLNDENASNHFLIAVEPLAGSGNSDTSVATLRPVSHRRANVEPMMVVAKEALPGKGVQHAKQNERKTDVSTSILSQLAV